MPAMRTPPTLSKNLNRLLSAAVVSPRFCHLLLSDPHAALVLGFNGETFQLTQAEIHAVTSVRVGTIRDFAKQLMVAYERYCEDSHIAAEEQINTRLAEVAVQ